MTCDYLERFFLFVCVIYLVLNNRVSGVGVAARLPKSLLELLHNSCVDGIFCLRRIYPDPNC